MWVIHTDGQAPTIISNGPDDKIEESIRRDNPGASIFACRVPGAFATYAAHVGATRTELVPITFPDPSNPEGDPLTGEQPQEVLAGYTVAVDASGLQLRLIDDHGQVVATLPIEAR